MTPNPTKPSELFRRNLQAALDARQWTQANLAERMDCTQPYISQVLLGKRDVTLGVLVKFADALNVSVPELFKDPSKCKKN